LDKSELTNKLEKAVETLKKVSSENEKNSSTQSSSMRNMTEANDSKVLQLERELDEYKAKSSVDIHEIHGKSEENLKSLKSFYETERERLERKIIEEKDKHERILNNTIDEYENRIKNEKIYSEEANDNLQSDMKELEISIMANKQGYEQEISSKDQKIELLEKALEDTKENLNRIQENSMATLKSAMSSFENEKKTLASKLESNNDEGNKKDLLTSKCNKKIDNIKNQTDREINELKR